ncbi:hypothetical protein NBRC116592_28780 [Colwellia sp. KU-HH00111]|uniref:hypothetical protein n=1 Tax=Colwellia sp. KU-HH00111 TaxID=3127652 RepID=UPI003109570B
MKNTYAYKLAIVATSLVMAYFASGLASIAQANELLKAEPIEQASLINQAQADLMSSFASINLSANSVQQSAKELIAMTKISSDKKSITINNKASLISD